MGMNLAKKTISPHPIDGKTTPGHRRPAGTWILPQRQSVRNTDDNNLIDWEDRPPGPIVSDIIAPGADLTVNNLTKGADFPVIYSLTPRQAAIVRVGGLLNYTRGGGK